MNRQIVTVQGTGLPVLEYAGARVITLALIDRVHRRPEGTARRNFSQHRERLEEGKHYFVRNSSEAAELGIVAPNGITLMTERGYLMLVKSFTDDLAWQVQDALVEAYFRATGLVPAPPRTYAEALREIADRAEASERDAMVIAEQGAQIAELTPRSAALARIADAKDTLTLTELAKALQRDRIEVRDDLERRGWIYRRSGSRNWLGYRDKVKQGLLTHKVDLVPVEGGREKMVEQVRFTAKGLAKLAEIYEREAAERAARLAPVTE